MTLLSYTLVIPRRQEQVQKAFDENLIEKYHKRRSLSAQRGAEQIWLMPNSPLVACPQIVQMSNDEVVQRQISLNSHRYPLYRPHQRSVS
ncbi:hypothetical protein [Fortiea sp. LEGE XX443]|uniref:hypothetical protein n=1 Tax=Fortiea sp. LEGE XX443 TaxID=1828611 RepID=UPI0030DA6449